MRMRIAGEGWTEPLIYLRNSADANESRHSAIPP